LFRTSFLSILKNCRKSWSETGMIKKVREYIHRHGMFQDGDRIVVGVSGGPDSMALLKILDRLKEELGITLVVAHLNHGLRGRDADDEAEWVRHRAYELGLPFFQKKVDITLLSNQAGLSVEDAARQERYAFFFQLLKDLPADKIAVGHHFHDQAETVLLNFLRGTGSRGLRGILPVRDRVLIRPLLPVRKDEILAYLKNEKVEYREDGSNRSPIFLRNRIRHDLIPHLKLYNCRIEEGLHGLAETMRLENDFLESQSTAVLEHWEIDLTAGEINVNLNDFNHLHEAIQRRIIKSILESNSGNLNGIAASHVGAVMRLIREGHVGQRLSLPFRTEVQRRYDEITFMKRIYRPASEEQNTQVIASDHNPFEGLTSDAFSYPVFSTSEELEIKETGNLLRFSLMKGRVQDLTAPNVAHVDYDKVAFPLIIRNMRPGDRFQPLGMKGTKKLKSYFIDRKVPREIRKKIPLLIDRQCILWIAGMTISEKVKVTESTRMVLKIEIN